MRYVPRIRLLCHAQFCEANCNKRLYGFLDQSEIAFS